MKSIRILSAATAVLILIGSAALAQSQPPQGYMGVRKACAADMQRLCPTVAPGHGAIAQCLKAHASEVSPGCHSAFEAARAARAERKAQAASSAPPPAAGAQSAPH